MRIRTPLAAVEHSRENLELKLRGIVLALLVVAMLPFPARAQSLADSGDSSAAIAVPPVEHPDLTYLRPTTSMRLHSYLFETFGPYPIVGAAIVGGINQVDNSPPEWRQDFGGYSKRWGSDFAIAGVTTTTRFALARAFREDTLYYRCNCAGTFPRLNHAIISTFTGRRGDDGHRVFSFPALVAPYAGTMAAVYLWYPSRYNAKDGFRMGNYSLLAYAAGNVALEFLYSGPHSWLARMHLTNSHGAPAPGSKP
jgi:nitrate reductase NapE component